MSELSPEVSAMARKIESLLLQRFSAVGQNVVADLLGVSGATESRMKTEDLKAWAIVIAALGAKVVPVETRCYDTETLTHVLGMAKLYVQGLTIDKLEADHS